LATLLVLVCLLGAPGPLPYVDGDRVRVVYEPGVRDLAVSLCDRLPLRVREVERALGGAQREWITVRLAADEPFAQMVGPRAEEYAAVAFPGRSTLVIKLSAIRPFAGEPLPAIVRHELVHVLLGNMNPDRRLPLWFEEGLAELVGGAFPVAAVEQLSAAVTAGRIRDFDDLSRSFPEDPRGFALAYRQSESFVTFLARELPPGGLRSVVGLFMQGRKLDAAIFEVGGETRAVLEQRWRDRLTEDNPLWLVLLRGHWWEFLLFVSAVLAIVAFVRYAFRRRRILREMDEDEAREDGREGI
jgi:Peptidase MA superfamily